jgi:hypothetical protein
MPFTFSLRIQRKVTEANAELVLAKPRIPDAIYFFFANPKKK